MDTQYDTTSHNHQPNCDRRLPDMSLLQKLSYQDFIIKSPPKHCRITCKGITCKGTVTENSCSIGHSGIYLLGRYNTNTNKEKLKNIPNLSIKNKFLSKLHCVIVYGHEANVFGNHATGWYVIDINSTNGTYADGIIRLAPYKHIAMNQMNFFTLAASNVRYSITVSAGDNNITELQQIL